MTERYDFSNDKFTKMLRFLWVVEACDLIYPRRSGEKSRFACLPVREFPKLPKTLRCQHHGN